MNYFISKESLTVFAMGKTYTVRDDHPRFSKIREGLMNGGYQTEEDLIADIDQQKMVEANLKTAKLTVANGVVWYHADNGENVLLNNTLTKRLVHMLKRGQDSEFLAMFIENLMDNPREEAIMELYDFLEENDLPITEDGCFLAYKKVRDNYTDLFSGEYDNSIGQITSMDRAEVDNDRNRTCSAGLHFASFSYMKHYGGSIGKGFRIMVVKINPRDVVSIPVDYNNAKGRCCQYEVVAELPTEDHQIRPWVANATIGYIVGDAWEEEGEWDTMIDSNTEEALN